jgi:hypothetical protein
MVDREARAISQLTHPQIACSVLSAQHGTAFLVMETRASQKCIENARVAFGGPDDARAFRLARSALSLIGRCL